MIHVVAGAYVPAAGESMGCESDVEEDAHDCCSSTVGGLEDAGAAERNALEKGTLAGELGSKRGDV